MVAPKAGVVNSYWRPLSERSRSESAIHLLDIAREKAKLPVGNACMQKSSVSIGVPRFCSSRLVISWPKYDFVAFTARSVLDSEQSMLSWVASVLEIPS